MKLGFIQHIISTTGLSLLQQAAGLGRHMLIAALFGVSREFDAYVIVFSVATFAVFSMSMVFDSIVVARLVQIREASGEAAFWAISNRVLGLSIILGPVFAGFLYVIVLLLLPVIAAGFNDAEREAILALAAMFAPWVICILPFYAVSAHLKSLWRFKTVFSAELLAMLASIAVLWLYHDGTMVLPLAYVVGSLLALAFLLLHRGFRRAAANPDMPGLMRGMGEQYLSNQIGSIGSITDRYFQSHLTAGGISALSYAGQIVNSLSGLMAFREIYVVPLASAISREEKLERMLKGIVLTSVPIAVFIHVFAEPMTQLLFQRGRFDMEAVRLTAMVMQILALSLITSSVQAPLVRLFQIMDRVRYNHVVFAASVICLAVFLYVFVFLLQAGAVGVAWAAMCNSVVMVVVAALLVRRLGIAVRWLVIVRYIAYAGSVAVLAVLAAATCATGFEPLLKLLVAGLVYGLLMLAGYVPIHRRIRAILGVN